MKNHFIVVEGLEGSGKTTAINTIKKTLNNIGISDIIFTREPGGTRLGEKIRKLIKYNFKNDQITHKSELLILYAARNQLIEKVIKPALMKGKWIISDRHDLSSQAYQIGGRGLNKKLVQLLRYLVLGKFQPSLTLYLDIPPELGLQRIYSRNKIDRIEKEPLSFFIKTREYYLKIISKNKNILLINANQKIEQVQNDINLILNKWLIKNI
ncbi:dTMP kinase [Candidatus Providencia siddallii]|uniref:Thymidylate kinase n=1 Tax=Candidatus Providencia siddallii TaxID=1715285 RepID=A0ABM9NP75_9GAMM